MTFNLRKKGRNRSQLDKSEAAEGERAFLTSDTPLRLVVMKAQQIRGTERNSVRLQGECESGVCCGVRQGNSCRFQIEAGTSSCKVLKTPPGVWLLTPQAGVLRAVSHWRVLHRSMTLSFVLQKPLGLQRVQSTGGQGQRGQLEAASAGQARQDGGLTGVLHCRSTLESFKT